MMPVTRDSRFFETIAHDQAPCDGMMFVQDEGRDKSVDKLRLEKVKEIALGALAKPRLLVVSAKIHHVFGVS